MRFPLLENVSGRQRPCLSSEEVENRVLEVIETIDAIYDLLRKEGWLRQ